MSVKSAIAEIGSEVEALFEALQPVADGFARVAGLGGALVREDLLDVRGAISDVFAAHDGFIAGCGVIPIPHLLDDAPYWMEWFFSVQGREPEALRVNLEPNAPDFFDYTAADWFVTPLRERQRHIAGPYVDYVCTNEYATTLALPVEVRGEFVGIAALDVTVTGWESRILPLLRGIAEPMTLTNSRGRVIATTSAFLSPGQRVELSGGVGIAGSTDFGWQLVEDAAILVEH